MKYLALIFLATYLATQIVLSSAEDAFVCEKDVAYKENDCNSCFCATDNKLGCTLKGCIFPESKRRELHDCKVGTTFDKDCNKCWCVKDLGTVCTDKEC